MDWNNLFKRAPERPLPKRGCSIAFYVVLLAIVVYLVTMFVLYKSQS
ncbi:MAG: hypothetical protein MJZ51_02675 [Bacteroidales bacterium]|nr:hypothetical protein [Bacteroidales bacterium]